MPLFDFTCKKCRHTFELLVLASTEQVCPRCGSRSLRKLISAPAPPGKSGRIIARGRAQAAREGHLSHYKRSGTRIVD